MIRKRKHRSTIMKKDPKINQREGGKRNKEKRKKINSEEKKKRKT